MAKVTISNLKKSFGPLKILHGIDLSIPSGQFISLLGPSGSGKTTILRCLAGLEIPDKESGAIKVGDLVYSGKDVFLAPEKRKLGMVFQNYAVWPHLNVFENVAFPLRVRKKRESEIQKKVGESLELVHLLGLENRFSHELSGGQQQRVALARALAMSPSLLLLDEPLSNLDALLREELGSEIQRLQKELGLTTILVTHDQKEALSLSDRIIVLDQGKIEADGKPEDLYSNPPTPFVAKFLAGAQSLGAELFLPRRWKELEGGKSFKIRSRIYLGSEYEYWAKSPEYSESIRFFSAKRHEIDGVVFLDYK